LQAARRGANRPVAFWQRMEESQSAWDTPPAPAYAPAYAPDYAPAYEAAGGGHPLADPAASLALRRHAETVEAAFAAIEPVLTRLAPLHFDLDFPEQARRALQGIGVDVPASCFATHIMKPLDMRFLYARCVIGTFCRLIGQGFDRGAAERTDGESARTVIARWGFHAIDITPCADGRLAGVLDHILRIPLSVVAFRKSYAGALFNVTEALRHWETVELRRWRNSEPNAASEPTRFLKIGVYHFSSADPSHHGCAAHGSDTARAAGALLERLQDFQQGLRNSHGAGADAAILLVGVDTDTDAIRVHVPDAAGQMRIDRFADSLKLHEQTAHLPREAAKDAIRDAVAACAGVSASDPATEGMRWFCGYLLKNNIAQVDSVRQHFGGRYKEAGHTEKLIVVGDAVDEVQLRNVAFQAQMETVEEGAADLDTGITILRQAHDQRGLAVPLLVHFRYDPRLPRSAERAAYKARRMMAAIIARYPALAARKKLFVQAVLREAGGQGLTVLDPTPQSLAILESYA
jgi:carboxysome shell carbonic anhydrase